MELTKNMTDFASLGCHLCNTVGTESCNEAYGECSCKPWYEGTYCENCRFIRDYVMAPNGSCIPCNCGLRSIYECFQRDLCMRYSGDNIREAIAVSALFLSAIATITCLSLCIIWRIIARGKRLRSNGNSLADETDYESCTSTRGSRMDLIERLSPEEEDDDDCDEDVSDRRHLLPSISEELDVLSVSSAPSTTSRSAPVAGGSGGLLQRGEAPRSGGGSVLRNGKSNSKYYFPHTGRDEVGEEV